MLASSDCYRFTRQGSPFRSNAFSANLCLCHIGRPALRLDMLRCTPLMAFISLSIACSASSWIQTPYLAEAAPGIAEATCTTEAFRRRYLRRCGGCQTVVTEGAARSHPALDGAAGLDHRGPRSGRQRPLNRSLCSYSSVAKAHSLLLMRSADLLNSISARLWWAWWRGSFAKARAADCRLHAIAVNGL